MKKDGSMQNFLNFRFHFCVAYPTTFQEFFKWISESNESVNHWDQLQKDRQARLQVAASDYEWL